MDHAYFYKMLVFFAVMAVVGLVAAERERAAILAARKSRARAQSQGD